MCLSSRLLCSINKLVGITLLMCQAFFYWSRGVVIILFGNQLIKKILGQAFIFNKKVCLILYSSEAFLSDEESDGEKALEVS